MKKLTFLSIFLFISFFSFSQSNVKSILDSILIKTKETSLYIHTINWDSLQKQVYLKAENAQSIPDLKPAFETLLNGLRDHHGKVINAKDYSYIAWFTDNKNKRFSDERKFDLEIWEAVSDTSLKFEYQLLKGKIGYLKIVGIGPHVNIEKESKKIRESIIYLTKKKVDKWIIDLRYNTGGNMHPMMAGIAPLIGNGIIGGLVNLRKEKIFDWEIKGNNFIYGGYQAVNLEDNPKFEKDPKIAVLTSRWTVSSGEVVATAFKGRPNTKFFGESTGGYTTNAGWDIIQNEVILVISTGIYCDRNGIIYENNIPVDVEVTFEITKDKEQDLCIKEAKKWLNQGN